MVTAALILTLLTVAASLASWLFGQWLARRMRISGVALAMGGGGALLLIGTVAVVTIGATTWWQRLMPVRASLPLTAAAVEPSLAPRADAWPATHCVVAMYSDRTSSWLLDNACGEVVAVAFQSCELGVTECRLGGNSRWRYEPAGILMTAANDKPVLLRVANNGPLVAPIFTIRDVAGTRRQIRYLACHVTAPRVLSLLRDSGGDELGQQRLAAGLRDDTCYSQVLRWVRDAKPLTIPSTGNRQ